MTDKTLLQLGVLSIESEPLSEAVKDQLRDTFTFLSVRPESAIHGMEKQFIEIQGGYHGL